MTSDDDEKKIRDRAYAIWDREGRVEGRALEHWHRARAEIQSAATRDDDTLATRDTALEPPALSLSPDYIGTLMVKFRA
jgi:hypothetical protein